VLFSKRAVINLIIIAMNLGMSAMELQRPVLDEQQLRDHLIKSVIEVNAEPGYEITPLMYAILTPELNSALTIPLFLNDQINAQSTEGITALMLAVAEDRPGLVCQLLASGAHVELKNRSGETALDLAKRRNNESIIRMLLEKISQNQQSNQILPMTIDQSEQKEKEFDPVVESDLLVEKNKRNKTLATKRGGKALSKKRVVKKSKTADKKYKCTCGFSSDYKQNLHRHERYTCTEK
jgi:hypothetical protein